MPAKIKPLKLKVKPVDEIKAPKLAVPAVPKGKSIAGRRKVDLDKVKF